ncbi:MAG: hypothetical protein ACI90A_001485 [Shewanella sp.]
MIIIIIIIIITTTLLGRVVVKCDLDHSFRAVNIT